MGRTDITTTQNPSQDWKRILPGLIISAVALVVVFYLADLGKFVEALRLADYRFVALNFLITLIWLFVRTNVWRTLLQEKATFRQVFFTINEGYLLNNFLPFRLGEVARAFLLGRKANLGFFQVFSTILIERALDMIMAVGLLISTLPFVVEAEWASQAAIGTGSVVFIGLSGLYLLARYRDWAMSQFEGLAKRWPSLLRVGSKQLEAFLSGLSVLTDGRRFLRAVAWMIVNWGIAIIQYYVLLLAFYSSVRLLWAAFSLSVAALGIAAPSSPGAVGVFELVVVGALSAFGLDPSTALAAALTAHLINYVITGILGVYALVRDGESLTGLYIRARHISESEAP